MPSPIVADPVDPFGLEVPGPDPGGDRDYTTIRAMLTPLLSGVLWLRGVLSGVIPHNFTIAAQPGGYPALTVQGKSELQGDVAVGGKLAVAGNTTVTGNVTAKNIVAETVNATTKLTAYQTEISGSLRFVGGGRELIKSKVTAVVNGMEVSPFTANYWGFESGPAGASVVLSNSVNLVDGDFVQISNVGAGTFNISDPGGLTLAVCKFGSIFTLLRDAGIWKVIRASNP